MPITALELREKLNVIKKAKAEKAQREWEEFQKKRDIVAQEWIEIILNPPVNQESWQDKCLQAANDGKSHYEFQLARKEEFYGTFEVAEIVLVPYLESFGYKVHFYTENNWHTIQIRWDDRDA